MSSSRRLFGLDHASDAGFKLNVGRQLLFVLEVGMNDPFNAQEAIFS